jgi:hypothetical protein
MTHRSEQPALPGHSSTPSTSWLSDFFNSTGRIWSWQRSLAPQKEGVRRSQQVFELWQPVARPPRAKTAATRSARTLRALVTGFPSTRARAPLPRTVASSRKKAEANVTGALVSSRRPAEGLEDANGVSSARLGSIPEEGVDESAPSSRRLGLLRWESRRAGERGLAQEMVACTSP